MMWKLEVKEKSRFGFLGFYINQTQPVMQDSYTSTINLVGGCYGSICKYPKKSKKFKFRRGC
jgi:hypothetical protein